jgi:hypothetical protein
MASLSHYYVYYYEGSFFSHLCAEEHEDRYTAAVPRTGDCGGKDHNVAPGESIGAHAGGHSQPLRSGVDVGNDVCVWGVCGGEAGRSKKLCSARGLSTNL